MAHKTEKQEETEFKVPDSTLTLCVNNCGFTGNPSTNNMCQKCFASSSVASILPPSSSPPHTLCASSRSPARASSPFPVFEIRDPKADVLAASIKREVNRCSGCRRKIGLTGFRCRCGELFCAQHRYSDRHDCSYDYKSAGREAIARENPVVKAAKIVRV